MGFRRVLVLFSGALLLLGLAFAFRQNEALFEVQEGYMLSNHLVKRLSVASEIDCALECNRHNLCKSLNYQRSDASQCQLNNKTKRSAPAQDFTSNANSGYYEKNPCHPNPCSHTGTCSKDSKSDGFLCSCMAGYKDPLCKTERLGWSSRKPGKSCQEILSAGDSRGNGAYWIDPGNPFKAFCDMTAEQGGWLLITNIVVPSSASVPPAIMGSSYRHIANYNDNKTFISASSLRELRQVVGFIQLRFHCSKASVGRMLHIITVQSALGYAVVDFFTAHNNTRPFSCSSFTRGAGDTSELAARCSSWGYSGKWGSSSRLNEKRLNDHTFFVAMKYHWISMLPVPECDAKGSATSAGDYWKIYVR